MGGRGARVLIAAVYIGIIVCASAKDAWRSYELGDETIDIHLTIWPSKIVVPLALALLELRLLVNLWGYLRLVVLPDAEPWAVPKAARRGRRARADSRRHGPHGPRLRPCSASGGEGSVDGTADGRPHRLRRLILLSVLGVRIAYRRGIIGAFGLIAVRGWGPGTGRRACSPTQESTNYTLSVLPMFILIGYLAYYAGITQGAFEAARRWFGWLPGGLAIGTVFAVGGLLAPSRAPAPRPPRCSPRRDPRDAAATATTSGSRPAWSRPAARSTR